MKTIREWRQKLFGSVTLDNFSNFSAITLALVMIGLLPIALSASKYPAEYYFMMGGVSFLVAAIIAWLRWSARKNPRHRLSERTAKTEIGINLDSGTDIDQIGEKEIGGIDYERFYRFFQWVAAAILVVIVVVVGLAVFYWKEIAEYALKNSIPMILITLGLAITICLMRMESKKELQEKRKAKKLDEERAWDY